MVSSVYCIVGLYHNIVKPCHIWGLRKIDSVNFNDLSDCMPYRSVAYTCISYNIAVSSRCLMLKYIFSSSVANYYTYNFIIILLSLIDYYCY